MQFRRNQLGGSTSYQWPVLTISEHVSRTTEQLTFYLLSNGRLANPLGVELFPRKARATSGWRIGTSILVAYAAALAMLFTSHSVAAAESSQLDTVQPPNSTSTQCATWVKAYVPYRHAGKAWVNGSYNNGCGRMARVCLSLQFYRPVFPVGGEWIWVGKNCGTAGTSPWDSTFGVTEDGPTMGYGQYVGTIIGLDRAGRQVAAHVGPIAAV